MRALAPLSGFLVVPLLLACSSSDRDFTVGGGTGDCSSPFPPPNCPGADGGGGGSGGGSGGGECSSSDEGVTVSGTVNLFTTKQLDSEDTVPFSEDATIIVPKADCTNIEYEYTGTDDDFTIQDVNPSANQWVKLVGGEGSPALDTILQIDSTSDIDLEAGQSKFFLVGRAPFEQLLSETGYEADASKAQVYLRTRMANGLPQDLAKMKLGAESEFRVAYLRTDWQDSEELTDGNQLTGPAFILFVSNLPVEAADEPVLVQLQVLVGPTSYLVPTWVQAGWVTYVEALLTN